MNNGGREPTDYEVNDYLSSTQITRLPGFDGMQANNAWGSSTYTMFFGVLIMAFFWFIRRAKRAQAEEDGDYKEFLDEKNVWESLSPQ